MRNINEDDVGAMTGERGRELRGRNGFKNPKVAQMREPRRDALAIN